MITAIGATWNRSSQLTATVLDLERFSSTGEIRVTVKGEPWAVCAGALFLCVPLASFAFTESTACKELGENVVKFLAGGSPDDMTYVYAADDRVRYSYNPGIDPRTRYLQALATLPHPLDSTEDLDCPIVRLCAERYIEEARRRAGAVGCELTTDDEDDFRKDLELAIRIDTGKITRQEAFLRRRSSDGGATIEEILNQETWSRCKLPQRIIVSQKLRVAIHKLTNDLLNEVSAGADDVIEEKVKRYIKEVRQLAARFDYRLSCFDDETFQLELVIANAADAGRIKRDTAIRKLDEITTRHLHNFYFWRQK